MNHFHPHKLDPLLIAFNKHFDVKCTFMYCSVFFITIYVYFPRVSVVHQAAQTIMKRFQVESKATCFVGQPATNKNKDAHDLNMNLISSQPLGSTIKMILNLVGLKIFTHAA